MEFFGECGEVTQVRVAMGEDGRSRGFAHVEFGSAAGAKKGLEKSGQDLGGRAIYCDIAQERAGGAGRTPPSGGRGGG